MIIALASKEVRHGFEINSKKGLLFTTSNRILDSSYSNSSILIDN